MSSRTPLLLAAGMALAFSACASGSGEARSRGSRDVILMEELTTMEQGDAYEAVARLRPRWLQSRGVSSIRSPSRDTPRVYVDGQFFGETDSLRSLDVREIEELRYLSASDATTRFGTNHVAGAILVVTRRG